MKEEFKNIYEYIIDSEDNSKMKVLGKVVKQIIYKMIENNPSLAKEYIEQLESVKWNNYLTDKEVENIVSNMNPKPYWSKNNWESMLDNRIKEEAPYFNHNALYVAMSMISSDSGDTLQKVVQDKESLFDLIYHLAIDKLKDKDKVFNIRKYFDV